MRLFSGTTYLVTALLLAVLAVSPAGKSEAIDRAELANVMQTIPPNGAFWKYGTLEMRRKTKKAGVTSVIFPHWSHRARYTCRVCHQDLGFSMRSGDTGITRSQNVSGKYCGVCHNGVTAFSVKDGRVRHCDKCHTKDTKALEQLFESFSSDLPFASFGNGIDWSAAIKAGKIAPLNSLNTGLPILPLPDKLKVPMKLGTSAARSDVIFSHEDHYFELDCSACHPDIFNIKKKGTKAFNMENNIYGNYCGACHMRVAFPMNDCKRCHPQMGGSYTP
ncbi:MAG: cytochrome c3 family protein [Desulfuromonadaceae bacterium]|nr:cytochrome c3 family protein [Desulfuromonadaceae bacterium]MDD5106311.1 cytochrome c3 family protein [Desulfuromonadaceae bacterium]